MFTTVAIKYDKQRPTIGAVGYVISHWLSHAIHAAPSAAAQALARPTVAATQTIAPRASATPTSAARAVPGPPHASWI